MPSVCCLRHPAPSCSGGAQRDGTAALQEQNPSRPSQDQPRTGTAPGQCRNQSGGVSQPSSLALLLGQEAPGSGAQPGEAPGGRGSAMGTGNPFGAGFASPPPGAQLCLSRCLSKADGVGQVTLRDFCLWLTWSISATKKKERGKGKEKEGRGREKGKIGRETGKWKEKEKGKGKREKRREERNQDVSVVLRLFIDFSIWTNKVSFKTQTLPP